MLETDWFMFLSNRLEISIPFILTFISFNNIYIEQLPEQHHTKKKNNRKNDLKHSLVIRSRHPVGLKKSY